MRGLVVLSALLVFLPCAAANAENDFYADLGYSYLNQEDSGLEVEVGAVSGHVGYFFNKTVSAEGELLIGSKDDTVLGVDVKLNYLAGAYIKAEKEIGDGIAIFGRIGAVYSEVEASVPGISISDNDSAAALGVGTFLTSPQGVYMRLDYTRYEGDEAGTNSFNIALGRKF